MDDPADMLSVSYFCSCC